MKRPKLKRKMVRVLSREWQAAADIAYLADIKVASVRQFLRQLEKKGLIEYRQMKAPRTYAYNLINIWKLCDGVSAGDVEKALNMM